MKTSVKGQLNITNMHLFYPEVQIFNEGEIDIKDNLSLHIDFPEKGKWYFMSFPFDVYKKDISSIFTLGDNQLNDGGNFLYALFYDGVNRNKTGQAKNNWSIVSPNEEGLVFEKGKGYLIAIDEKADQSLLTLTIPSENIPDEFGKKDIISVNIDDHLSSSSPKHYGWILCGNPLPSPLALNQLTSVAIPDNIIYIYEEGFYKSYSLKSDYVLAPFSTFFIKAAASTKITVNSSIPENKELILKTFNPLLTKQIEPGEESPTSIDKIPELVPKWYNKGSNLHLIHMPQMGNVIVRDLSGRIIHKQTFQAGHSIISLPLSKGIYLLEIRSGLYHDQDKFIITQ